MTKMKHLWIICLFLLPPVARAEMLVNEVQILPTEARFIELRNTGGADVNLTGWYIQRKTATGSSFNSLVTSTQFEGKNIKAGGYLLISRGALPWADIVIENLTLTEGNTLRMRNVDGEDVDQVTWGSIPDGQSYQRTSSGEWIISAPTPGGGKSQEPTEGSQSQQTNEAQPQPPTQTTQGAPFVEPTIKAYAGADRTVLAGSDVLFEGKATGLKNEPLEPERFSWNFGDGAITDGENVRHIYRYPGDYVVVLHAVSGKYAASDYARVRVIPADIVISGADQNGAYVEIANKANTDIDVSLFRIRANAKEFTIPDHTIFAKGASVRFAQNITGLSFRANDSISLLYPNGEILFVFSWAEAPGASVPSVHTPSVQTFSQKTIPLSSEESGEALGESVFVDDASASSSFSASASAFPAEKNENKNDIAWWGALIVVAALSAGSVAWVRRKERAARPKDAEELSADDFDIVDISGK